MKTLKQIQEGFFNTSGAGEDAAVENIIKKYGIEVDEIKSLKRIPIPPNMVYLNGNNMDIVSKHSKSTDINTRIFYNIVYVSTNEKNIPFKINIDGGDTHKWGIIIEDCPNLENVGFISKSFSKIFIKNCGGRKGVDISGLNGVAIPEIENTCISNFGNINLGINFSMTMNQESLNNTDFKNFPSSNTTSLLIGSYVFDTIKELNLKNIPKNHNEVIVNNMPSILGNIDLGFKTLIIGSTWDRSKVIPENLKDWLMTTDFKGTKIILRNKYKGSTSKIQTIINSVIKKRPDIANLILCQ